MKIRRTKNFLYIFSSVMVLGLALVSFDTMEPKEHTVSLPTSTPIPGQSTSTPVPSKTPEHTPTPTPTPVSTPTPTPTSTPTPTPTPSLTELNAAIAIQPATDDIGTELTTIITNYLNDYYSNQELFVTKLDNIICYYKPGLSNTEYFVYVSYDITHEGSNVPIPTLEEYVVTVAGESISVTSDPVDALTKEALYLSRGSESVFELHVQELIRRYMNAKLSVDEALLSSLVTDSSYLNFDEIRKKTEYIENYNNLRFLIQSCPENVVEFDYVIFVANDVKIVNINTLAPGVDEFLISVDENNYPHIFLGITSEETDNYREFLRKQEDYQTFYNTYVFQPLTEAILLDSDLRDYMERLIGGKIEFETTE